MSVLAYIVLFSIVGGALSVLAAAVFLLFPDRVRRASLPYLVSFAIGAMLGAAFLALLPHAVLTADADIHEVTLAVLVGLLVFFILEKLVLWRHCHTTHCEVHGADTDDHHHHAVAPAGVLVLVGDSFHNFVDGVLIAAAFLTDINLGIVTALAVAAHEIPQEVGDFAILLESGFNRARAFVFNILSSLASVAGGVLAYYALQQVQAVVPFVLALAASSFIYVAVADLIPGLHKRTEVKAAVEQVLLIVAGVVVIYLAHSAVH